MPIVGGSPASQSDLEWNALAAKRRLDGLTELRSRAEKWAAAMITILGLLGLSSILAGRDTIQKFDPFVATLLVMLTGGSIVLAARATWLGTRAAQGEPELFYVTGPRLRTITGEWAERTVQDLEQMRRLALVAFALAGFALALFVLAPKPSSPAPSPSTLIIRTDGSLACGSLGATTGQLQITPAGGAAIAIDPHEILAIHSVTSCP